MKKSNKKNAILIAGFFFAVGSFLGCAVIGKGAPSAKLIIAPNETVLTPALLKEPIKISGSGWKPNEMIIVDIMIPPEKIAEGVKEVGNVGIAFAKADSNGNFETVLSPMTVLMSFLQVGWDDAKSAPDFKQARPLPPGAYPILASGVDSAIEAGGTLTILPPLDKK